MLLGKSREITRKNERASRSGTDVQLWMLCLVVTVQSNTAKNNIIETRNVRSVNQGKLDVVKKAKAKVNTDILGISELKWTGMDEFNSDDHYTYCCGQEALRINGVAIIVKKESEMQYLDAISKMTESSLFISKANHSISE